MAKALQRRRGTHEEHKNFVGLEGEFSYDTTEKRIVAHDGVTAGGIPMAKKSEVDAIDVGVTSVNGNAGDITPEQTGCLPLGGGTMTGSTLMGSGYAIGRAINNGALIISGGPDFTSSPRISIFGKEHESSPGRIALLATNGTNSSTLAVEPGGALTLGGKHLVRSVNGIEADASGDVAITATNLNLKLKRNTDIKSEQTVTGKTWTKTYTLPKQGRTSISVYGYVGDTTSMTLQILVDGTEVKKETVTTGLNTIGYTSTLPAGTVITGKKTTGKNSSDKGTFTVTIQPIEFE